MQTKPTKENLEQEGNLWIYDGFWKGYYTLCAMAVYGKQSPGSTVRQAVSIHIFSYGCRQGSLKNFGRECSGPKMEGIGWEWQSIDGSMVKAPLALESVGHNPTDRGKMGTKRSILVEIRGIPLAVVISRANTHDVKLLEKTLDAVIITCPEAIQHAPQHLCADAAYTGNRASEAMSERTYATHVRSRGEEKAEKQEGKKVRRWVVEVTFSWFNRFRKLLVRWEKKEKNCLALLHFACAIIVRRKLLHVHRQLFTDRL